METMPNDNENKTAFEGVESVEEESFTASGKGGSGKDTSNNAIRLWAKINNPDLLQRLRELYPGSVTNDGRFRVEYQRERYWSQNRNCAYELLEERLTEANKTPKERVETKPTRSSQTKRLSEKKQQGEKKQSRSKVTPDSE